MSRYQLREIGVFDNDEARLVLPHRDGWLAYLAWLAAGNEPAPPPPPVAPDPPSQAELDARAELAERDSIRDTLRGDAALTAIKRMTPAQIDAYIAANVVDLASARNVLRIIARIVALLARERLS